MTDSQATHVPYSSFGEPVVEYSFDQGKTWAPGPMIGENTLVRVVHSDGSILWMGRAKPDVKVCDRCEGTGIRKSWRYDGIDATGRNHTSSDVL